MGHPSSPAHDSLSCGSYSAGAKAPLNFCFKKEAQQTQIPDFPTRAIVQVQTTKVIKPNHCSDGQACKNPVNRIGEKMTKLASDQGTLIENFNYPEDDEEDLEEDEDYDELGSKCQSKGVWVNHICAKGIEKNENKKNKRNCLSECIGLSKGTQGASQVMRRWVRRNDTLQKHDITSLINEQQNTTQKDFDSFYVSKNQKGSQYPAEIPINQGQGCLDLTNNRVLIESGCVSSENILEEITQTQHLVRQAIQWKSRSGQNWLSAKYPSNRNITYHQFNKYSNLIGTNQFDSISSSRRGQLVYHVVQELTDGQTNTVNGNSKSTVAMTAKLPKPQCLSVGGGGFSKNIVIKKIERGKRLRTHNPSSPKRVIRTQGNERKAEETLASSLQQRQRSTSPQEQSGESQKIKVTNLIQQVKYSSGQNHHSQLATQSRQNHLMNQLAATHKKKKISQPCYLPDQMDLTQMRDSFIQPALAALSSQNNIDFVQQATIYPQYRGFQKQLSQEQQIINKKTTSPLKGSCSQSTLMGVLPKNTGSNCYPNHQGPTSLSNGMTHPNQLGQDGSIQDQHPVFQQAKGPSITGSKEILSARQETCKGNQNNSEWLQDQVHGLSQVRGYFSEQHLTKLDQSDIPNIDGPVDATVVNQDEFCEEFVAEKQMNNAKNQKIGTQARDNNNDRVNTQECGKREHDKFRSSLQQKGNQNGYLKAKVTNITLDLSDLKFHNKTEKISPKQINASSPHSEQPDHPAEYIYENERYRGAYRCQEQPRILRIINKFNQLKKVPMVAAHTRNLSKQAPQKDSTMNSHTQQTVFNQPTPSHPLSGPSCSLLHQTVDLSPSFNLIQNVATMGPTPSPVTPTQIGGSDALAFKLRNVDDLTATLRPEDELGEDLEEEVSEATGRVRKEVIRKSKVSSFVEKLCRGGGQKNGNNTTEKDGINQSLTTPVKEPKSFQNSQIFSDTEQKGDEVDYQDDKVSLVPYENIAGTTRTIEEVSPEKSGQVCVLDSFEQLKANRRQIWGVASGEKMKPKFQNNNKDLNQEIAEFSVDQIKVSDGVNTRIGKYVPGTQTPKGNNDKLSKNARNKAKQDHNFQKQAEWYWEYQKNSPYDNRSRSTSSLSLQKALNQKINEIFRKKQLAAVSNGTIRPRQDNNNKNDIGRKLAAELAYLNAFYLKEGRAASDVRGLYVRDIRDDQSQGRPSFLESDQPANLLKNIREIKETMAQQKIKDTKLHVNTGDTIDDLQYFIQENYLVPSSEKQPQCGVQSAEILNYKGLKPAKAVRLCQNPTTFSEFNMVIQNDMSRHKQTMPCRLNQKSELTVNQMMSLYSNNQREDFKSSGSRAISITNHAIQNPHTTRFQFLSPPHFMSLVQPQTPSLKSNLQKQHKNLLKSGSLNSKRHSSSTSINYHAHYLSELHSYLQHKTANRVHPASLPIQPTVGDVAKMAAVCAVMDQR